MNLYLPPLAQRKEDIPLLAQHMIDKFNPMFGTKITGIAPSAMQRLISYAWPGNVRELSHAVESAFNLMELEEETIETHHLPVHLRELPAAAVAAPLPIKPNSGAEADSAGKLPDRMKQLERDAIIAALQQHHYNISLAAKALGMKRQALQYKLNRYGIAKKP